MFASIISTVNSEGGLHRWQRPHLAISLDIQVDAILMVCARRIRRRAAAARRVRVDELNVVAGSGSRRLDTSVERRKVFDAAIANGLSRRAVCRKDNLDAGGCSRAQGVDCARHP